MSFLRKCVLVPPCFFFLRKPTFYLKVLDINDTTKVKNITVSSLWNRILKIWDIYFELMQLETQCKKNYLTFFCNMKLELWNETFICNKKIHVQNQQKYFKNIFADIWSVNNPIQMAAFFETFRDYFWLWR